MINYIIVVLLLTLLASCSNDSAVNNPSSTDFNDNIILTKNPHDSTLNIYGFEFSSNRLRYITDLGVGVSNVYDNKIFVVKLGYFILSEIYVFDIKSKTYVLIPRGTDYPSYATLSPDASKVLYTTDAGDMLVVINSDGTNRRVFSTVMNGRETMAEFSPDGKQIAYAERNPNAIYTIDTSGNNRFKVVEISQPISGDRLSWSPDSKTIAFSNKTTSLINNIWKVNADGSDLVNLTNYEYYESNPAFSPDGQYIAFVRYGSSGFTDILYMKTDGSNQINLTNTVDVHEHFPSWSPDSKKIMYYKGIGGNNTFYIYDITTQNVVQIDSTFTANWNYTK